MMIGIGLLFWFSVSLHIVMWLNKPILVGEFTYAGVEWDIRVVRPGLSPFKWGLQINTFGRFSDVPHVAEFLKLHSRTPFGIKQRPLLEWARENWGLASMVPSLIALFTVTVGRYVAELMWINYLKHFAI